MPREYHEHGKINTRLYRVWAGMKDRCYNPHHKLYHRYGGRGIKVCNEWCGNFMLFYNWAISNGYDETAPRGKCTLDRIDNDGDYSPNNCRWLDLIEQNKHKNNNIWISYNGESHIIADWAKILNIHPSVLGTRFRLGWSAERAFNTPVRPRKKVTRRLQNVV